MDYLRFLVVQYVVTIGWALAGAISMGVGLGVALRVFTLLTPNIDEMEELKKGNIGVAIVLAAVILAMGAVVAVTIMPEAVRAGGAR
jgi:uncharacterized membrane protein YjfL (UPF0719 family)